ncbi:ribonuclease H1 domain-containing protein [Tissierella creatinophila]|uniref:ribonuclease H n=1 Tax=Tissierella creatinophila DSM 6911 TaxID=1123403 RepID=A0A1U7M739_TISCR|nr:ribonuclease H family protein [Tissierella creatinophila]OLS03029.1 ribonuclease H [Tissierella creatinophila DSM 6911]
MSKYFYAVRIGNAPGVYTTWSECEREVKGFKGAQYKKFKTYQEALGFVENKTSIPLQDNIEGKELEEEIKEEIKEDEEKTISEDEMVAYVDGSFDLSTMTFSYGVVIITSEDIETFKGIDRDEELAKMRNVSGELKAAMVAMDIAIDKGYKKLFLHYDYAGIEKWAIGEWKTNKNGTRAYKQYYDCVKGKLDVKFVKVAAHTGVKYNELADKLAKEAIDESFI